MPVYDYKCGDHGVFSQLATFEESAQPARCPQCGTLSARVIVLAPSILAMAKEKKMALDRNEQARHEPLISTVDSRLEQQDRAKHQSRHKCGCGSSSHHHSHELASKSVDTSSRKMLYTAEGNKIFPSARPWMISH